MSHSFMDRRHAITLCALAVVAALLLGSCADTSPTATPVPTPDPTLGEAQVITLGDIDPEEPGKKIRRFQPLSNYLARHLGEFGIREGRVVIARNIDEMARFLRDGIVDIYLDSPFPTLAVQALSGSEILLRRWKGGQPSYWSTYVALRGNGVAGVEDLLGKVIAFEEPYSTSGFVLPAGALKLRGFELREVDGPDAEVGPHEIGYFFSGDEENSIELIRLGRVAGAGISNEDYDELPAELKEQIVAFDQTVTVPRQLVSVRPGLDRALVDRARNLLMGLDQTDEGRLILENMKQTKRFDPVPSDEGVALGELRAMMGLLAEN